MTYNDIIILFLCLVLVFLITEVIPFLIKIFMVGLIGYLLYEAFYKKDSTFCGKDLSLNSCDKKPLNIPSGDAETLDSKLLGPEFLRHEYIGQDDLNFNSVDLTPFDIENFDDAPSSDNLGVSEQVKKLVNFENEPYELVSQYRHAEDILGKHDTEPHDIDEQLAFKQRERGYKNFYALTGITSATRNAFDRYLRGELDENEARVWYSAEADVSNDL